MNLIYIDYSLPKDEQIKMNKIFNEQLIIYYKKYGKAIRDNMWGSKE